MLRKARHRCCWNTSLNQVDNTGNIKFTFDKEKNGYIAFLNTKLTRKEDGKVKVQIYRKKAHTNQYLLFSSIHPVHHKLAVVHTILDQSDSLVTEEEDRTLEVETVK